MKSAAALMYCLSLMPFVTRFSRLAAAASAPGGILNVVGWWILGPSRCSGFCILQSASRSVADKPIPPASASPSSISPQSRRFSIIPRVPGLSGARFDFAKDWTSPANVYVGKVVVHWNKDININRLEWFLKELKSLKSCVSLVYV